jgi:hypothetical protein
VKSCLDIRFCDVEVCEGFWSFFQNRLSSKAFLSASFSDVSSWFAFNFGLISRL